MKANIPNIKNGVLQQPIQIELNTAPHNVRFDHAKQNCLFFRVRSYKWAEMLDHAIKLDAMNHRESGKTKRTTSFIRLAIKTHHGDGRVDACFVFRYTVELEQKKSKNDVKRKTVIEREKVYTIDASREEIAALADPVLQEIDAVNTPKAAALIRSLYSDAIHPATLEQIAATLTEEENIKAARILRAYFAA